MRVDSDMLTCTLAGIRIGLNAGELTCVEASVVPRILAGVVAYPFPAIIVRQSAYLSNVTVLHRW
jgi:hypothetical protein